MNQTAQEPIRIKIDAAHAEALPNRIFGHNLEHTRGALTGGLSAQLLKNRKFAGKPSPAGVAADWEGLGDRAFYQTEGESYTRHAEGCDMPRRNELQRQSVQNIYGGECGIAQKGLFLEGGRAYELRLAAKSGASVTLTASLTDADGSTVYAARAFNLTPGDWQIHRATFTPPISDENAALRLTFTARTEVIFGAVSLLPEDHFHGMRRDVVECLKQIAPTVLRWPGGNFAGEYRWKDGLLPPDERGPLESLMEDETQTYAHGYDFHEIGTDEFIALCREVGAEPFFTINPVWCAPEESRQWVEYCNGAADTEYGAKRAERGHPAPYNVRLWSLGNELGYGHMEGPNSPAGYAALARTHADAMLAADPEITLFSAGPYPNDDWARDSAAALTPVSQCVSLHHYAFIRMDYTPAHAKETYEAVANAPGGALALAERMRQSLDRFAPGAMISFDEWNVWYSWFRPSCAAEGVFTAKMLHMLINNASRLGIALAAYFQPVNEGAIEVTPAGARLSADGQMFAMARGHHCGKRCPLTGADDFTAAATVKDGAVYVTLVNDSFDAPRAYEIAGVPGEAQGVVYASESALPYTYFTETALPVTKTGDTAFLTLPPHSAAAVRFAL